MKIPIYQVDAFAESVFTGNPAAVCPLENWLPDAILQSIALENNLSETAFYIKRGDDYEIRWFTPNREVDLCGHATLAAAHVLFHGEKAVDGDGVTFQSRSGELKVQRQDDCLTLDFPAQPGAVCEIPEHLVEALGLRPVALYRAMDYMAVFDAEEEIRAIQPNFELLQKLDLRGVIVTAPGREVDFVSRCFYPKYHVPEDPVTGSAHCTLAPYWAERLERNILSARQLSRRGGVLACEVKKDRVLISGKAVLYLKGEIFLPT